MTIKNQSILLNKTHKTQFEIKRKELLNKFEISLWLNSYNDLYSDFDPRPNYQRAISQDFLDESKRAIRYNKEDNFQLTLLVDEKIRDTT